MTIRMLEAERDQGVTCVCATPHFYAHRRSVDFFLERRDSAMEAVKQEIECREDLPKIIAGAEVLYFRGIERAELLPRLCLEGTNILLLEMPFDQWTSEMANAIETLITKRELSVVMAHVERYLRFQKDKNAWSKVINMPLTLQLNAESFIEEGSWLKPNKEHKLCMQLLTEYDNYIIASDCHNLTDRKPNLENARSVVKNKFGSDKLVELDQFIEQGIE